MFPDKVRSIPLNAGERGRAQAQAGRARVRGHIPMAYRLAGSFAAIFILGMGLLSALVLNSQEELMLERIDDHGNSIVRQFARSATEPLFTENDFTLQVIANNLIADPQIVGAAVFDEGGRQLLAAGSVPQAAPERLGGAGGTAGGTATWEATTEEESLLSFTSPISFEGVVAGHAVVSLSVAPIRASFQQTAQLLLWATLAMTLLGIAMAVWMSRRSARPVERLVAASDTLASGNFDVQLRLDRRDEFGKLSAAFNRMARSLREKQKMEGLFSRFVADDVAKTMLSDLDNIDLGCKRVEASVLFVDIVGFTELSEHASPEEVVDLLNEYFAYFTLCGRLFFGTVDKFIGDCAMINFGAPRSNTDHRFNAIACATVMLRLMDRLNARRRRRSEREIQVRVGINSGPMMAGIVGASQRMEYTVVGDTVNVASRLCSLARPGDIVVGESVSGDPSLGGRVSFHNCDEVTVRGRRGLIRTRRIAGIAPEYRRTMDTMIADILAEAPSVTERADPAADVEKVRA